MPPALLRYRVSELLSEESFLRVGHGCAHHVAEQALAMGLDLDRCHRVLDFGCGCGRTLVWLLRAHPGVEFHGVDVDREAIEQCQKHLASAHFVACRHLPPLPHPDGHFDFIYCFSVLTHLDEAMQDLWLAELRRVLKPDGLLLVTVHGRRTAHMLDATDQMQLDAAGFLFKTSKKLKGIVPSWYQTAWHCRDYIVARLSKGFQEVRYIAIPDGAQDIVIGRKRSHGPGREL